MSENMKGIDTFDIGYAASKAEFAKEREQLRAENERLRHENHNLNWALGTKGYPVMYDEAEQAEADAAHSASLQVIHKMKEQKSEFDRLKEENAELTRKLAEQQLAILNCEGACGCKTEELTKLIEEARKQERANFSVSGWLRGHEFIPLPELARDGDVPVYTVRDESIRAKGN